jgi:hypothetical protein
MITRPTTAQLIDAVREDLQTRVAPVVADPPAKLALQMCLLVLGSAAVRSDHELAFMLDEADAIEALARDLAERLPEAGPLAEALAEHERDTAPPREVAAVHGRYERASEVLSLAAEAAYDAGDAEAITAVLAVFDRRRRNQNTITGGYEAVGRA